MATETGNNNFIDGSQQDATEFLEVFIDILKREMMNDIIFNTFTGIEVVRRKFCSNELGVCRKCKELPQVHRDFFSMLPVFVDENRQASLQVLLDEKLIEYIDMRCSNVCCQCGKHKEGEECLQKVICT